MMSIDHHMAVSVLTWDTSVMDATKMDLGIWVNIKYSGKSPVFAEKPSIRIKAE